MHTFEYDPHKSQVNKEKIVLALVKHSNYGMTVRA